MKTHYPSRQEVAFVQRDRMAALDRQREYAEYEGPDAPVILYRQVVRQKGCAPPPAENSGGFKLLHEHEAFLRDLCEFSTDGLRARYDRLGHSVEKGNRILRELKEAKCLFVHRVPTNNPKGGRTRVVATLTDRGRTLLRALQNTKTH